MTHNLPNAGCHGNPESNHNSLRWTLRTADHLRFIVGAFSQQQATEQSRRGSMAKPFVCRLTYRCRHPAEGESAMHPEVAAVQKLHHNLTMFILKKAHTNENLSTTTILPLATNSNSGRPIHFVRLALELRRLAGWLRCLCVFWRGREQQRHMF